MTPFGHCGTLSWTSVEPVESSTHGYNQDKSRKSFPLLMRSGPCGLGVTSGVLSFPWLLRGLFSPFWIFLFSHLEPGSSYQTSLGDLWWWRSGSRKMLIINLLPPSNGLILPNRLNWLLHENPKPFSQDQFVSIIPFLFFIWSASCARLTDWTLLSVSGLSYHQATFPFIICLTVT